MARCNLIKRLQFCHKCVGEQRLRYVKRSSAIDKYIWICKRPCTVSKSVREFSFFTATKLSFQDIFFALHKYINGYPFIDIAYELNRDRDTKSNLTDFAREIICEHILKNCLCIGGLDELGNSKIVEIDESKYFKRKYNRGRMGHEEWYIGGIERGSRKCFIVPVQNRNADTITEIITRYVLDGSIVITDKWRAYAKSLSKMPRLEHLNVNYSLNFVDLFNPMVQTQNIEGLWSRSKYFLRTRKGLSLEQQSEYLIYFL